MYNAPPLHGKLESLYIFWLAKSQDNDASAVAKSQDQARRLGGFGGSDAPPARMRRSLVRAVSGRGNITAPWQRLCRDGTNTLIRPIQTKRLETNKRYSAKAF